MTPVAFLAMIVRCGGTPRLAKDTWRVLAPTIRQADLYHLNRLRDGSEAALAHVLQRFTPKVLIGAIEKISPPSGRVREREIIRLEESLLMMVGHDGRWK